MDTFFVALITGLIAVTCILVVSIMVSMYADTKRRAERAAESEQKRARAQANNIVHGALKRANEMMVKAELTGIQTVAQKKLEAEKFEEEYERGLEEVLAHTLRDFAHANHVLEREYKEFLDKVRTTIADRLSKNAQELEKSILSMRDDAQKNLEEFMQKQQEKIESHIDDEISNTHKLLAEYRAHRQKLVDEDIVDLVEATTKELLSTQISVKDHTAAVLDSLNEAKRQGFFEKQAST